MKLSKSKLALAKVINENGGWPERALWAAQDNCIAFFLGGKPEYKSGDRCWYSNCLDGACVGTITRDEKVTNWHQTILSREEYYQAHPKADADAALGDLVAAGEALGLEIGVAKPKPELVITDWRDLRVGDEIECVGYGHPHAIGVVEMFDEISVDQNISVRHQNGDASWPRLWKFIRRP